MFDIRNLVFVEETSGDMMVPEGSSAKLVCKARGFPKPKITVSTKIKCVIERKKQIFQNLFALFLFVYQWRREDGREIIARNGPHGKTKGH